jgi:hypothetical protein
MKNKNVFVNCCLTTLFAFLLTLSVSGQVVKTEDCIKSKENIKACFDTFTDQLKSLKSNAEQKALVLKQRFDKNDAKLTSLKSSYERARENANTTIKLIKNKNLNFDTVKQQYDTTEINQRKFIDEANLALGAKEVEPRDGLISMIAVFACKFIPGVPPIVCEYLMVIIREYDFKRLEWQKWDKIKA